MYKLTTYCKGLATLFLAILPVISKAAINVYCKADVAPYLYVWTDNGDVLQGGWPGALMTQTTVKNGETYWYQSFNESQINLIFNNGMGAQTGDFTGITDDCTFIYDGNSFAYGAIPPEAFSTCNYYVFYVNTDHWSKVYMKTTTAGGSEEQKLMTFRGYDMAGFEVYMWESNELEEMPSSVGFNNGSYSSTPTASFTNGGYYVYTFYASYSVLQLDCVAVIDPNDEAQRPKLLNYNYDISNNSIEAWNSPEATKQVHVEGKYFNRFGRDAELLYSVDNADWQSIAQLTSDQDFSVDFGVKFIAGQGLKYDFNGDGVIDMDDAQYLIDLFRNGDDMSFFLDDEGNDLDGDGVVSVSDLNTLVNMIRFGDLPTQGGGEGTPLHTLRIAARDISGTFSVINEYPYYETSVLTFNIPNEARTYNGSGITLSNATLVSGDDIAYHQDTHFQISEYANNINAGTATATVIGLPGGCMGSASVNFEILPAALSGTVSLSSSDEAEVTYNGKAHTPSAVVVHDNFGRLNEGTDYELEYANNVKPGTALIHAIGKGNFTDTLTTSFTILKAPMPNVGVTIELTETDILYDGEPHSVTVYWASVAGLGEATVYYINDGAVQSTPPIEPGTYFVNITFAEGECYLPGSIENAASFTIYTLDESDWNSLKALYNATDGPNWNKTIDLSDVKKARQLIENNLAAFSKGRIVQLNLSNLGLVGEVPVDGVRFTALQSLDVSNNNLYGNIGSFVEPMTSLTTLNIANNGFSDLYPPLSPMLTNVTLGRQVDVSRTISVNLKDSDKDNVVAQIPRIYLYSVAHRDYNGDVSARITAPDNWEGSFLLSNGNFTFQNTSPGVAFKGQSGDTYPIEFSNLETSANGVATLRLEFEQGDADFSGEVNVVDLQAIINWIFNVYNNKPFNWTAGNVIVDERLNVQDVVGEVNLLLASESNGAPRRDAPKRSDKLPESEAQAGADAYLYWHNNLLYLSSPRPVAALDITLNGNVTWDIAKYGLVTTTKDNHIVAYSLNGNTIPAGETAIAMASESIPEVLNAMLSDTDAQEIRVGYSAPGIITGLNSIKPADVNVMAADGGRVLIKLPQPLTDASWAVYSVNGRLVASGNDDMIGAGSTTLAHGLEASVYLVRIATPNQPAYITKIAIIR